LSKYHPFGPLNDPHLNKSESPFPRDASGLPNLVKINLVVLEKKSFKGKVDG